MRLMSLHVMRVNAAVLLQGRCGRMMLAACSVQRGRSHAAGHAIYAQAKTRIPLQRTRTQMKEQTNTSRRCSRTRGRSSATGGTMAPMRATAGAPLPSAPLVLPKARSKARPVNVFVPWCAELTRASLRCARSASNAPGEPPARQATERTLGVWAEQ